ncbi:hypothetical protein QJS66_13310 [Kocuria rhizophila]|nr:hypothetical protein QJS66_13310 [Kocuria rhizophila]
MNTFHGPALGHRRPSGREMPGSATGEVVALPRVHPRGARRRRDRRPRGTTCVGGG